MRTKALSRAGRMLETLYESAVISRNLAHELHDWVFHINRLSVLSFAQKNFADVYARLDGGDRRIISAFLEPEFISNTLSLLGKPMFKDPLSEYRFGLDPLASFCWLRDAFGAQACNDTSYIITSEKCVCESGL